MPENNESGNKSASGPSGDSGEAKELPNYIESKRVGRAGIVVESLKSQRRRDRDAALSSGGTTATVTVPGGSAAVPASPAEVMARGASGVASSTSVSTGSTGSAGSAESPPVPDAPAR
jgi:hypothetical protein